MTCCLCVISGLNIVNFLLFLGHVFSCCNFLITYSLDFKTDDQFLGLTTLVLHLSLVILIFHRQFIEDRDTYYYWDSV